MAKAKKLAIIAVIAVVVLVVIFALIGEYLKSAYSSIPTPTSTKAPPTSLYSGMVSQQLLFYRNGQYIVPYALMSFLSSNSPKVYFNASLLLNPPPSKIYMLNYSSCYDCGNLAAFEGDLSGYLGKYNISGYNNISLVSQPTLLGIQNNSILIIPTGLMPTFMLGNVNGTNTTYVQALLNKGVSIIYIGQSFSSLLLPNGIVIPNSNIPPFLVTSSTSPSNNSAGFHFTNRTFAFDAGSRYGSISYENEYNGSIVAFSNYLNTWPSESDAAYDVARAVAESFWLPRYLNASYSTAANPYVSTSGKAGLIFNSSTVPFSQANINKLNSGALRIVVSNSRNYSISDNSRYLYLTYKPDYSINGTLSIPASTLPGSSFEAAIVIFTHSAVPVGVQPHITIYNTTTYSAIRTIELKYANVAGNFSFLQFLRPDIGPGDYIAEVQSFSGSVYSASLFSVPPINIVLTRSNFTNNNYIFSLTSQGAPLSGIPYTIYLDGIYPENGTIQNGTISYSLPRGTQQFYGNLNFRIEMLATNFTYTAVHPSPTISIPSEYVEIAVVAIIVLLLVTLVRAPNKDEFYIDVPNLPKHPSTPIKIKENEVLLAFDKLNSYYHWRYMPLSRNEVKLAISSNIRVNSMPVNLTLSNVEVILDELVSHGDIVEMNEFYAPKYWITQSGHDIEYLTVFKLLRLFMISHAFVFTDLDASPVADMVVALQGEKRYIVIYSQTSKFKNVPVYANSKTYVAFINSDRLTEFKDRLYGTPSPGNEQFKLYLASGMIKLVDANNPDEILS